MTNTTTASTPILTSAPRLARAIPKAEDFAPLDRKPRTDRNFSRGARKNTSRARRIIL